MSDDPVQLEEILLIDDSDADNYLHQRVIRNVGCTARVAVCEDGREALEYLKSIKSATPPRPTLIFLDLNMPCVDGWEFLEAYEKAEGEQAPVIVMLTTSLNPDHKARAETLSSVADFLSKPLTADSLRAVLQKFFPGHGWQ